MPKSIVFSIFAVTCFLTGCGNKATTPKTVKLYSAEQLYNNNSIGGAAYNSDETGILVNSNLTGIYNLYELNVADTSLKPLTHSLKESFFAIDYLPGTNK